MDQVRIPLFDILEANGWYWEGSHLYAPRGSFAIERHKERELPLSMLVKVHERMSQKLEGLRRDGPADMDKGRRAAHLSDLEALVSTLRELIAGAGGTGVNDGAI